MEMHNGAKLLNTRQFWWFSFPLPKIKKKQIKIKMNNVFKCYNNINMYNVPILPIQNDV